MKNLTEVKIITIEIIIQKEFLLIELGVEGERVQMYNLSSSEGPRFAQIAVEMDERIRTLGPNPIKLAKNKAA